MRTRLLRAAAGFVVAVNFCVPTLALAAPGSVSLEANCLPAALAQETNEQKGLALSAQWTDDRGFLWEFWTGPEGWALTILAIGDDKTAFRCLMGAGTPAGDPA